MNDETICEQGAVNQAPKNEKKINETQQPAQQKPAANPSAAPKATNPPKPSNAPKPTGAKPVEKKKGMGAGGVVGISTGAAVAGAVAGVLIPAQAFPDLMSDVKDLFNMNDEEVSAEVLTEVEPEAAPEPEQVSHVVGHDMNVATGVNDSMSFNEAFAAARHELGAGGLFVWHGNTYGTYYGSEWNAMSDEEHDQYWADVYHTTSNIEYEPEVEPEQDPVAEANATSDLGLNDVASNEENQDADAQPETGLETDASLENQDVATPEGEAVEEEILIDSDVVVDGDNVLVINEEDVLAAGDLNDDGQIDTLIIDADGNEIPDVVLDTTGDGNMDTLVLNPDFNDEESMGITEDNVLEIDGIDLVPEQDAEEPDLDITINDMGGDDVASSLDLDMSVDMNVDSDLPIDNNMDMSDFV